MIRSYVINKYLSKEFLKITINICFIFICLAFIMSLFEEINFFKDSDVNINLPIVLALLFVPGLVNNFFPFVILVSGIWFFLKIKKTDELTAINVSGISNFSVIMIPSILSILIGIFFITSLNPITSVLIKKYETIKGEYERDQDYLAAITENGIWIKEKNSEKNPLTFVGKGVCFDTGGISLKPARFMEEMKYDMAGSAVVVGLLKSLALRKAKVNVVGVVGLVENMPGSNAQRPGDIVKSYSGKTIEVLNTDAEGRLVLADALTFAEKKYKPKFIVDLATLTGAIIISLGEEYAGLFSNNDELSKNIFKASENVNEKVWRLPLHKNYDKLIDSTIADVQNINYAGGAGSITAAQFLQRFIMNKTPWAHLDIAGMAFSKKAANLNPGGATGFGVRLLNNLIKEYYE